MLSNAIICYYANCKECRLKELSFYRKILQVDDRIEDEKLEKVGQREISRVVKVRNTEDNLELCRVES